VLSGGERARVALSKMLTRPANFLCLDEPTNHLDVTAREVLEGALGQFPGALIFISHDRYFINGLATRVVEVRGGRLRSFPGSYDEYLDACRREAETATAPAPATGARNGAGGSQVPAADGDGAVPAGRRAGRRTRAEAVQERSRALRPMRERLAAVEAEIHTLEARQDELTMSMADPALYRDGEQARAAAHEKRATEERVAALMAEWEALARRLEAEA
jgi:ATP-binding cassette subfamily F protein 3